MIFKTLKEAEFQKFAEKSPYKSFFQTVEIAKLRASHGWTPHFVGVEEDGKLKAATMLVSKPTFLGRSTFYAPGGPLVDYEDKTLLSFFIKKLVEYVKSKNGYVLRIEPYYELIERDRDGTIVENGFNHQKAAKNLESLGFIKTEAENPVYAFVLDLKNREEKELFASFKQNTRNLINRTARKGVIVRELGREELAKFKQITESTSKRRNFDDKPLSYYETMYDFFSKKGQVKFLVAEISDGAEDGTEDEAEPSLGNATLRQSAGASSQNYRGHELESETANFGESSTDRGDFDDCEPRTSQSSIPKLIPISAAMFMTFGDEVIYLFSGSDAKYMKEYNAQYAIQWYMIKYALNHHFARYNFYGIKGLPDPNSKDYGIYKFKKGFDGHVTEMIGAYEIPVNRSIYKLHRFLSRIKKLV